MIASLHSIEAAFRRLISVAAPEWLDPGMLVALVMIAMLVAIAILHDRRTRAKPRDRMLAAVSQTTAYSHTQDIGLTPTWHIIAGKYVPAAYFMFASEPPLSREKIRTAIKKHGRVLIGFDAGEIPRTGPIGLSSYLEAKALGAELEIYVEGPGGPTNEKWTADEIQRIEEAARSIGIDTTKKGWRDREWDTWGWKTYTFQQLIDYRRQGFNQAEVDNLDRVLQNPDELIAFYKEYARTRGTDTLPQLIMKNLDEAAMARVVDALKRGEIPRHMFSEFHIFEIETDDSPRHCRLINQISGNQKICTIPSFTKREEYEAAGHFDYEKQFDEFMKLCNAASPAEDYLTRTQHKEGAPG